VVTRRHEIWTPRPEFDSRPTLREYRITATVLAAQFADVRLLHVGCVALSGTLFTIRGLLRIGDFALANHPLVRHVSYVIDTVLLVAAILLTLIVHQYPFVDGWLTMKVLLLVLYIVLGSVALKRARTRAGRLLALLGALCTFTLIIGVAITHHPAGWLLWLRR
jgi:uncharacterized membrane protein SirB2